jgi:hypothetical protein
MEQLHILRCQVWKSHLCPKRSISVQGFKEAVRWLANLDTIEISRPGNAGCVTAPLAQGKKGE